MWLQWCIVFVEGTTAVTGAGAIAPARPADERDKQVIFKNCSSFANCITEINNTHIDNIKDIDGVMPMCNSIEYNINHSVTSGSLWQYYKEKPIVNITDSESFKYNKKIIGGTPTDGNAK